MSQKSARRVALEAFKAAAKKVRNGAYFVKRGPINWAVFPFPKHPRAIAITIDTQDFLPHNGIHNAEVAIEMAAAMPGDDEEPGIDDGLMDDLTEDAEEIVRQLLTKQDALGDAVALKVVGRSIDEFHDSELRVQGVIVHLSVGW